MPPAFKNIVLCSDGTGNTAVKGRGTNVFKLFEAVDLNGHRFNRELVPQIAYYDDGVGTEQVKLLKLMGGAFGCGLKRNVKELYTALCRCYRPGDQIYLFGFSRGAYTIRTLGGLIIRCGIVDKSHWCKKEHPEKELKQLVSEAYKAFRTTFRRFQWTRRKLLSRRNAKIDPKTRLPQAGLEESRPEPLGQEATDDFRSRYAVKNPEHAPEGRVKVRFIGVWDTVAAVGLPIKEMADFVNEVIHPFKFEDLKLNEDQVTKACHAISIDDERKTFHPEMWDESRERNTQRIEQAWFSGVHSNVGGGYPKQGLSLVALDWMMAKAHEEDLRFLENVWRDYRQKQNVHDKLYNSRSGLSIYYRYQPRDIQEICARNGVHPKVHVSALQRIALATDGYAPGNLPDSFEVLSSNPAAPGEDPATLRGLEQEIRRSESAETGPRLLDHARKSVLLRRRVHAFFWVVTLGLVALAAVPFPIVSENVPKVPEWLASRLADAASMVPLVGDYVAGLLDDWPYLVGALLFLLILYVVSLMARKHMGRVFSTFWRNRLVVPWWLPTTLSERRD